MAGEAGSCRAAWRGIIVSRVVLVTVLTVSHFFLFFFAVVVPVVFAGCLVCSVVLVFGERERERCVDESKLTFS